jgi:hypothetical protein
LPAWLLNREAERKSTVADRGPGSLLRSLRLCQRSAASRNDDLHQ